MFNERMALKTRLDELDARETRVAKECREERERIYERLRKLDEQDLYYTEKPNLENEENIVSHEPGNFLPNETLPEGMNELKEQMVKQTSDLFNSYVQESIQPVINNLQKSIEKEHTDKEQLLQTLEESNALNKQFQEIFRANSELKNRSKIEENKNNRRGRTNSRGTEKPHKETVDYSVLDKTALSILKQHTAFVQSSDLKKDIEARTGMKIQNMTNFMQRLMKQNPQIEKPYRGGYIYRKESENNGDEGLVDKEIGSTTEERKNSFNQTENLSNEQSEVKIGEEE